MNRDRGGTQIPRHIGFAAKNSGDNIQPDQTATEAGEGKGGQHNVTVFARPGSSS